MGFIEFAIVLLIIGVPIAVVAVVFRSGNGKAALTGRSRQAAIAQARWHAHSRVVDDRTIVTVAKSIPAGDGEESLGQMVVAEIPASDPEWDIKVSQAMMDARVRAEILNQEEGA